MVKRVFLLFLFLPIFLFGNQKKDILNQVGWAFENNEFEKCADLAKTWAVLYPEDKIYAEACYSLFILAKGNVEEFVQIYNPIKCELSMQAAPHLLHAYNRIGEIVVTSQKEKLKNLMNKYECSFQNFECRRGWKIKCVLGALCYTTGLFILPFNPAVGGALMTSAGSLMLDGTLGALDEQDEWKERQVNQNVCDIKKHSFPVIPFN